MPHESSYMDWSNTLTTSPRNVARKRARDSDWPNHRQVEIQCPAGSAKRARHVQHSTLLYQTTPSDRGSRAPVNVSRFNNSDDMNIDTDSDSWNTRSVSPRPSYQDIPSTRSRTTISDDVDTTYSDGFSLLPVSIPSNAHVTTVSTWVAHS